MRMKVSLVGAAVVAILLLATVYQLAYHTAVDELTITVTDKERIVTGSGDSLSSKYLIFTDNEVFENTDSLVFWKFGSSTVQGRLKVGETYRVKVAGWRNEFMSMYRNIIEVRK